MSTLWVSKCVKWQPFCAICVISYVILTSLQSLQDALNVFKCAESAEYTSDAGTKLLTRASPGLPNEWSPLELAGGFLPLWSPARMSPQGIPQLLTELGKDWWTYVNLCELVQHLKLKFGEHGELVGEFVGIWKLGREVNWTSPESTEPCLWHCGHVLWS